MGKPPLTVVGLDATGSPPPRPLGRHGTALWDAITREYRVDDPAGVEFLTQACAAADRVEALAERIDADGSVIHTKAGPKAHPALRDELAGRAFIVRTLERLGLNYEALRPASGRPPGRS